VIQRSVAALHGQQGKDQRAESGKIADELGKQEGRKVRIWKPRKHKVIRRWLIRGPLGRPFGLLVDVTRLPAAPFPRPDFRRLLLRCDGLRPS